MNFNKQQVRYQATKDDCQTLISRFLAEAGLEAALELLPESGRQAKQNLIKVF